MGVKLRSPGLAQGRAWVRGGFATFARKPLGFVGLLVSYAACMLLLLLVPLAGPLLAAASWPLLSLAFMLATQDVLHGLPVRSSHLFALLRARRRGAMLQLCGGFALGMAAAVAFAMWLGGDELARAFGALPKDRPPTADDLGQLLNNAAVVRTQAWVTGLSMLISVPWWHALALVRWGGQTALQALFSSTLGLWRTRLPFALYSLQWLGITLAGSVLATVVGALLAAIGLAPLAVIVSLGLMLALSAAFYVSLWFMFEDTFEPDGAAAESPPSTSAPPSVPPAG